MRSKKSQFPLGLVLLVAMLAVGALALIGATLSKAKSLRDQANAKQLEPRPEAKAAPAAEKVAKKVDPMAASPAAAAPVVGPDWPVPDPTHRDLANYLTAKGLPVEMEGVGGALVTFTIDTEYGRGVILVALHDTVREARLQSGATSFEHCQIGRFFFAPVLPADDAFKQSAGRAALRKVAEVAKK